MSFLSPPCLQNLGWGGFIWAPDFRGVPVCGHLVLCAKAEHPFGGTHGRESSSLPFQQEADPKGRSSDQLQPSKGNPVVLPQAKPHVPEPPETATPAGGQICWGLQVRVQSCLAFKWV